MGKYDIDKDVYKNWLEGKIITIEAMTTREEIEARILEIYQIEFFAKAEWALLHSRFDKITGRKGIAPWLKEERDKLITDPNIKVNWDGEPRKKEPREKKEKRAKLDMSELLGIDTDELTASIKTKREENKDGKKEEKPKSVMDLLIEVQPKAQPIKATPEEIKAKADALRERARLAREAKEKEKENQPS